MCLFPWREDRRRQSKCIRPWEQCEPHQKCHSGPSVHTVCIKLCHISQGYFHMNKVRVILARRRGNRCQVGK